jgi:capsular exopolysaccharide synthesis family protein
VTAKRISYQTLLAQAREQRNNTAQASVLDGPPVQKLLQDLGQAQVESAELLQKVTGDFPAAVAAQARIRMLKKVISEMRDANINVLNSKYEAEVNAEKALQDEISQQKDRAYDTSKKAVKYNILKREYETSKDLYNAVIRELKESQLRAASKGTNIAVADYASLPAFASSPKRGLAIVFALILGPIFGIGLALVLEAQDTTLKTREDVSMVTMLPVLGSVPSFDDVNAGVKQEDNQKKSYMTKVRRLLSPFDKNADNLPAVESRDEEFPSMVTIRSPRSAVAEAFRTIRTNILLSSADAPPRTILTTSVEKGDGKTTLVSNLAIMLAKGGHKTLLLDADSRRPALHRWFSVPPTGSGLVDYLAGQVSLNEIVFESGIPNLSLLPAGTPAPNPAELVGSQKMAELLKILAMRFDYVLLDSPPLLAVSDSLMLSRAVDGVVLVVRQGVTEKHLAVEACRQLQRINATVLGVVVNDTNEDVDALNYWREVA